MGVKLFSLLFFLLLLTPVLSLQAQEPQLINYQGRISAGGAGFDGRGSFKFALVDAAGTNSYWSNDGTSVSGSEPAEPVTLTVAEGRYSVLLGDVSLPHMKAVPGDIFQHSGVYLRVWFDDGVNGSQQLSPDAKIAALSGGHHGRESEGDEPPATDAWFQRTGGTPLPARYGMSPVWTGSEMLIWGGFGAGDMNLGARYNPVANSWSPMNLTSAPAARFGHSAVWTGTEMIVWGGIAESAIVNTGGKYNPVLDKWTATNAAAPSARTQHAAVWTGSEMIIWGGTSSGGDNLGSGGRYDPAADAWTPVNNTGAPSPRYLHTAVWTGTEIIVWGGYDGTSYVNDGGRYRPADNHWTAIASTGAVTGRTYHTAVWTGSEMIVWGGYNDSGFQNTGARYNPAGNAWAAVPAAGAPVARYLHSSVWTGNEMIVWGGFFYSGTSFVFNDGGRYNPVTGVWTPLTLTGAPSARQLHAAVWTGSQMVVWGGADAATSGMNDGGRYDPSTDTWRPILTAGGAGASARYSHSAVWTGAEMIVWGGYGGGYLNDGGRYNPVTNAWTGVSTGGAPLARTNHTAVWTGSEMIVWGGTDSTPAQFRMNSGGRYNPATNQWSPTNLVGAPTARMWHSVVWTGNEMIVWGGDGGGYQNTGGRYNPSNDSWTAVPLAEAPGKRRFHSAVWTGSEMIVWGGYDGADYLNSGARYSPAANGWLPVSLTGAPSPRSSPVAVWTGTEMILWGGINVVTILPDYLKNGARYNPVNDSWIPMTDAGAPRGRELGSEVWTGKELIVWGGSGYGVFNVGARYNPAEDRWQPTTGTGAPSPRFRHTAVWTGSEMLIFGGYQAASMSDNFSYVPDAGVFTITGIVRNNGSLVISFSSLPGRRCTLWYSDSLAAGSWKDSGLPALTGTGGSLGFLLSVPNAPRRFYRVQGAP